MKPELKDLIKIHLIGAAVLLAIGAMAFGAEAN